jgi:hypothetical protein
LGHQLEPTPLRITEFAPALPEPSTQAAARPVSSAPASGYSPPTTATSFKTGRFTGADFSLQPDGMLRCPAGQSLLAHERRREADGSLRVVYAASIRSCRPCPLREQCQWNGSETHKPRQVSVLLHPLSVGGEPLRLRETGVGEFIGGPACNSCVTNGWRSKGNLTSLPIEMTRLCLFPEHRGYTAGSPGHSARHGMPAGRSRHQSSSTSLACQTLLPLSSDWKEWACEASARCAAADYRARPVVSHCAQSAR